MSGDRDLVNELLDAIGEYEAHTNVRETGFTLHVKWTGRKPVMDGAKPGMALRLAKLFEAAPGLLQLSLNSLDAHDHFDGDRCETCDLWTAEQEAVRS